MMGPGEERYTVFVRALLLHDWSVQQYRSAIYGYSLREHVEEAHPDQRELTEELGLARLDPDEREAWLFGYRFRDRPAPGGEEGGDGGSGGSGLDPRADPGLAGEAPRR